MKTDNHTHETCDHHHHSAHNHHHAQHEHDLSDGVTSHIHEGALVCSGNKQITGDLEQVKQKLVQETKRLDDWVAEQEGITGHIKTLIIADGPVFKVSATGGDVESTDLQLTNFRVSIAAIVFQVDQESLEQQIKSLLERL